MQSCGTLVHRGLRFGHVSISLVLLLLLNALIGPGTPQAQGFATLREPPQQPAAAAARTARSSPAEDGARVMERGLGNAGAPVIGADVIVEDDDNGSAGEADEAYGENNGNHARNVHNVNNDDDDSTEKENKLYPVDVNELNVCLQFDQSPPSGSSNICVNDPIRNILSQKCPVMNMNGFTELSRAEKHGEREKKQQKKRWRRAI
ncbi:hypothetical protein F2P81_002988 [Scophthalmus maximus]|uniref:Uncharacterized protein n=1 Tax=Scophthalmus maximus TaxID=52904 RepID=A0A6A4TJK2_SCOMX|nr:hypothetical protein F2P81_002988 [Scophthalmus maximus]